MPVPVALAILTQVLDVVDSTAAGVALLLAPGNIVIAQGGVARLIDAAALPRPPEHPWAYTAPEYVIAGQLDARADLFAAGVIAHELLANQPLFAGADEMDTLARVRSMDVPMPSHINPQVPVAIDHVVMTALARDPEQRWQAASAMRNALAVVIERQGLGLTPSQLQQWIDAVFSDGAAPVSPPAKPLAALLGETGQLAAIPGAQPRLATGAEPLWDADRTPTPRPRIPTPAAPAIVVSVHPKKAAERKEKARRGAVIAVSVVLTLAVAAVGYFLLA